MKCIECKHLNRIANTDETRQGICGYPMSFFPVCVDEECKYALAPYTCKDCDRFGNDWACMTALEDDPVDSEYGMCWGFIDKKESEVFSALAEWTLRGYDIQEKLDKVLKDFKEEFKSPFNQ